MNVLLINYLVTQAVLAAFSDVEVAKHLLGELFGTDAATRISILKLRHVSRYTR